ncbi:MAG TPA: helix-turn-helix transcriptional regulator [Blastocatellia bacterium]
MLKLLIDEQLERIGKTVYWLGKQPGLTEVTVYRLRYRKTGAIKFDTIEALCDALGCEPGELFARTGGKTPPRLATRRK